MRRDNVKEAIIVIQLTCKDWKVDEGYRYVIPFIKHHKNKGLTKSLSTKYIFKVPRQRLWGQTLEVISARRATT